MRGLLLAAALLGALAIVPSASAHVGHAPSYVFIRGGAFEPSSVTVAAGDQVFWVWEGPRYGRSVTSDPGQDEFFDSDPAGVPGPDAHRAPNDLFSHTFTIPGTYGYFDKADPATRGTVTVTEAVGGTGDTAPPQIAGLRVRGRTARFALSERSDAVFKLRPRRRGGTRKIFERRLRPGPVRVRIPGRVRPGSYTLHLYATDAAGNRSETRRARFSVRRSSGASARAAVHARRCGGLTYRGRDYLVRSQIVSCRFARRWALNYLRSRRRPSSAWRCNSTPSGTRQRIPFVCRASRQRAYWVERA